MSENSSIPARLLNPCLLHLQKLALELKCPICLNLLNRPMLLPCNHILCKMCIPKSNHLGSECQLCKRLFSAQDVKPAPYMENMVTIYRNLDATFKTDLLQPHTPDAGNVLQVSNISLNKVKEPVGSPLEGNSSNSKSKFSLTAKKRVFASLNSLDEENKSTRNQEEYKLNNNKKGLSGQLEGAEKFIEESDFIEVIQSSPSSSPDDIKDSKSNASMVKCPANTVVDTDKIKRERDERFSSGEDSFQDLKRQKNTSNLMTSRSDSKSGECCVVEAPKILDPCGTNNSICAFCQTSEVTDKIGLMLHYVHGKEVVGEAAMNSNAIHVHKTCIEWTPQTYFVGETVKNLKAEIARASKLKCTHCGIKGAALGCYMKSCRRTYHVPCAVEIAECRWDTAEFLLLCPTHSTVKFPGEKSKSGKRIREKQQPAPAAITKKSTSIESPPDGVTPLIFCGSALSSEEKFQLVKFASHCGASVTKFWNPNVTHVIASTDSNGAYIRTLKVLKAILYGRWIIKTDWIKASMKAMQPVDEEPYEVCQDKYGCCNAPKKGRLRAATENAPKLFDSLNFYFFGDFVPGYKDDLLDLVITAGGTIIKRKEELVAQNNVDKKTPTNTMVVYNSDFMPEEDDHAGKERIESAKKFAYESGCKVIDHTWLLESIASCSVNRF